MHTKERIPCSFPWDASKHKNVILATNYFGQYINGYQGNKYVIKALVRRQTRYMQTPEVHL